MEQIKEEVMNNERWRTDGNCKYCRKVKYCGKDCKAREMRVARISGVLLKLALLTRGKIRNRTDALVALKAVDAKQDNPHTTEQLEVILRHMEEIAVKKQQSIRNLVSAIAVHVALDHVDLETAVSWLEDD